MAAASGSGLVGSGFLLSGGVKLIRTFCSTDDWLACSTVDAIGSPEIFIIIPWFRELSNGKSRRNFRFCN